MEETDREQGWADAFSALNSTQQSALSIQPLHIPVARRNLRILQHTSQSSCSFEFARHRPAIAVKVADAFARQYEFGSALEEILLLISCTGGFPNSRVYSRL